MGKKSHERRVYESVDDESISQNWREKGSRQNGLMEINNLVLVNLYFSGGYGLTLTTVEL